MTRPGLRHHHAATRSRPFSIIPKRLDLILADQIYIAREHLPPALRNRLVRLAAFQNPEFYGRSPCGCDVHKPRIIYCAEEHASMLACPACLKRSRNFSGH